MIIQSGLVRLLTEEQCEDIVSKIDSLNIEELMAITKEYGWQKRAWVILWHQRGNHNY